MTLYLSINRQFCPMKSLPISLNNPAIDLCVPLFGYRCWWRVVSLFSHVPLSVSWCTLHIIFTDHWIITCHYILASDHYRPMQGIRPWPKPLVWPKPLFFPLIGRTFPNPWMLLVRSCEERHERPQQFIRSMFIIQCTQNNWLWYREWLYIKRIAVSPLSRP